MKRISSMIKFQIIVVFVLSVIFTRVGYPQEKIVGGGLGFFGTGVQSLDIKNLNARLKLFNYPEFDEQYTAIGGGGYGFVKNFVIGGEGYGLIGFDKSNQFYKTNLMAGYGLFNMGYILYSSGGLNIFPVFGFGAGGIDLRINEKFVSDFDSVLVNPKRGSLMSVGGLLFNIGVNFTYTFNLGDDENKFNGLMVGVSLGYKQFLQLGSWTLFENDIANGPDVGLSGFYLNFLIGGGGGARK